MALIKTSRVSGNVEIQGVQVNLDFELTYPLNIAFNFSQGETQVYGNLVNDKLTFYSVNNGIVSDELMEAIKNEILLIEQDYQDDITNQPTVIAEEQI